MKEGFGRPKLSRMHFFSHKSQVGVVVFFSKKGFDHENYYCAVVVPTTPRDSVFGPYAMHKAAFNVKLMIKKPGCMLRTSPAAP